MNPEKQLSRMAPRWATKAEIYLSKTGHSEKDKKRDKWLALNFFFGLLFVTLFCLIAFDQVDFIKRVVNSDTLMPAAFFLDVIRHGDAWRSFELPRIPSIVPDLAVFGTVQWLTGSWRSAYLCYAILSLSALALLAGWIIDRISRCGWVRGTSIFLLVSLPMLLAELSSFPVLHLNILQPVSHGGPFILAVGALCVLFLYLKKPSYWQLALLFIAVAAGVLSDKLFIIAFHAAAVAAVGPIIVTGAMRIGKAQAIRLILTILASSAIGFVMDRMTIRQPDMGMPWHDIPTTTAHLLFSSFLLFASEPAVIFFCFFLPLALATYVVVRSLARTRIELAASLAAAELFWAGAAAGSALASLAAAAVIYQDLQSYRYLTPLVWWPVILSCSLIAPFVARLPVLAVNSIILAILTVYSVSASPRGIHSPALLSYRDPLTSCLLKVRQSARLHAGLATYWLARYVSALSDWQFQIDQAKGDGVAYYWENNPVWYTHDPNDPSYLTPYNFIIVVVPRDPVHPDGRATLMPDGVRALYGSPDRVLQCPLDDGAPPSAPHAEIWIYKDSTYIGQIVRTRSRDLFELSLGNRKGICIDPRERADGTFDLYRGRAAAKVPSYVATWGPDIAGPVGLARVSLFYKLTSPAAAPGLWTITAGSIKKPLFSGLLPLADGAFTKVSADVDFGKKREPVEISTTLHEHSQIVVKGIEVSPAHGLAANCEW